MSLSIKRFAIPVLTLFVHLTLGLVLAFGLTAEPAKAYADPGSGAVLWQLFFASIVSIGFNFRKLRTWFTSRRPRR